MTKDKKPTPREQVELDYQSAALALGDFEYRKTRIIEKMRELNELGMAMDKKAKEEVSEPDAILEPEIDELNKEA